MNCKAFKAFIPRPSTEENVIHRRSSVLLTRLAMLALRETEALVSFSHYGRSGHCMGTRRADAAALALAVPCGQLQAGQTLFTVYLIAVLAPRLKCPLPRSSCADHPMHDVHVPCVLPGRQPASPHAWGSLQVSFRTCMVRLHGLYCCC